jgi:FG-GAP repeat
MVHTRVAARLGSLVPIALAALVLAVPTRAGVIVGVTDNAGEDGEQAPWFFSTMGAEGLQRVTLTLRWDDGSPTVVPNEAAVERALGLAEENGVSVALDLFPLHSQVFTGGARCAPSDDPESCGDTALIRQFAAWTATVATTFPTVHQFVVMNECNQPLFVNPQWYTSGQNQSAEICGRALAASYDALKAVSAENFVWGVGLSPRGNDNPNAISGSSTSPVRFLQALGAWFRAFAAETGRTAPLMDGLDFHPYPVPQSQPFAQGYQDVDNASVSNLPRIYDAFYTGFNGTPQRTIGQQAGGGLPVSLNEVGVQTATAGHAGYVGTEVSATSAGGVLGDYATEAYQSSWYVQMLDLLACDPNLRVVNIYHLIDEAGLAGWQSGLYYVDQMPKQSATTVHDWIATTGSGCSGAMHPWTPSGVPAVAGAPAPPRVASGARVVAAVGGRLRIFDAATHTLRRVLAPFGDAFSGPLTVAVSGGGKAGASRIAVATGPGIVPRVKLLDGTTGRTIASWSPFARSSRGGVSLALGALGGRGTTDVVVGSGPGSPAQVKVYDAKTRKLLETLSPFGDSYRGGVSVAAGDVNGDGRADLIVGSGRDLKPTVIIFSGQTATSLGSLAPFSATVLGGVSVAARDLDGDGRAEVIAGSGPGTPAAVSIYSGVTRRRLWTLQPFGSTFTGGAAVAAGFLHGTRADLVVATGEGGGSQIRIWNGRTHAILTSFLAAPGSAAVSVAAG